MTDVQNQHDEHSQLLGGQQPQAMSEEEQNRHFARMAMERQRLIHQNRNDRNVVRQNMNENNERANAATRAAVAGGQTELEQPGDALPPAPSPVYGEPIRQNQQAGANESQNISSGSLGLNMSFANLWTTITAEQEKKVWNEFYLDIILLVVCETILALIRKMDPIGCGIPLRRWLMVFCALYFSRSTFQLIKIFVIRNFNQYKVIYDCSAFALCNGAMAIWLYYGYDIFYSDANNCDNKDSTAFLSSAMFVILFLGYFLIFIYLMILFTVPCLYLAIREQAEMTRINGGGVAQAQVPMILASLSRTQYDPSRFQHESNCVICLVDYEEQDMVTQLRCDERHYFHTSCVEGWIKNGNNRCPYCRAPIINFGENRSGDDSEASSVNGHAQPLHR